MVAILQKNDLFIAVKELDAKAVEYCILQGLDPNALDKFGKPPLYYVIMEGVGKNSHAPKFNQLRETIQVLLFYGAKQNHLNKKEKSLLEDFMRGYKGNKIESILLDSNKQSYTPIKPAIVTQNVLTKQKNEFSYEENELIKKFEMIKQSMSLKDKVIIFLEEYLEGILISLIGFSLPFYIKNLKGEVIASGDAFWSKTSLFLILPILTLSILFIRDFWKEKKFFRLLITIPTFISSFSFIIQLFYMQIPLVQYSFLNSDYRECFSTNISICSKRQKGIYEDFLLSDKGKYLRSDKDVLSALTKGIRPHSIWANIGNANSLEQTSLQKEFTKRGFVYFISELDNGKTPNEIILDNNWNSVFYSIAFGEANPELLELDSIPNEWKSKLNPTNQFPVGILNSEMINGFYQNSILDINNLSREETELAIYLLTQFTIDLDANSFETLINHWILFNKQFEKELNQLTYMRNQLRNQLLVSKKDTPIGVNFSEESDWVFYKPFLTSTGIEFTRGEDLLLNFHLQPVNEITQKPMNRIIFPEIIPLEKEVPIYTFLVNGLSNELKEIYKSSGEETWIYALPASLVCKTCE